MWTVFGIAWLAYTVYRRNWRGLFIALFITLLVIGLNLHPNLLGWIMLGVLATIAFDKDFRVAFAELGAAIKEARKGPVWHR